jgi:cytochrome P450
LNDASCDDDPVRDEADLHDHDLTDHQLYRNGFPHDLFVELRARGPVLRHRRVALERVPQGREFWVVLRHAQVEQASRDVDTFSSLDGPSIGGNAEMRGQMLVSADAPMHTRLRKLISAGFTPRMIARLGELIARRAEEILDPVVARGECDFVRRVAYVLPMHLIAELFRYAQTLGEDNAPDRRTTCGACSRWRRWIAGAAGAPGSARGGARRPQPPRYRRRRDRPLGEPGHVLYARTATRDTELGGRAIRAGERVAL